MDFIERSIQKSLEKKSKTDELQKEEIVEENIERLKEPMGGKILVCEESFGGFNKGDFIKTSNKNGWFKIKLFDSEKNKLVKDADWIKVNTGDDFEDFSNSFVFKKEENSEPVLGEKAIEEETKELSKEANEMLRKTLSDTYMEKRGDKKMKTTIETTAKEKIAEIKQFIEGIEDKSFENLAEDELEKKAEKIRVYLGETLFNEIENRDLENELLKYNDRIEQVLGKKTEQDVLKKKEELENEKPATETVAEIDWDELENNMYRKLYEKLEKEYEEDKDRDLYAKKLKEDLEKFEIGNIDKEDEEFLKSFGLDEEDTKNKRLYKKVLRRILSELDDIEKTDDKEKEYAVDDITKAQENAEILKEITDEKIEEKKWNDLDNLMKEKVESLWEYYIRAHEENREFTITSIKDEAVAYTVDEKYIKSILENAKIEFTIENKERLAGLASELYSELLDKIESEQEPETPENIQPEISEEEKRCEAENLEGEKTARENRDKMWNRVTKIGKVIADNPEMPSEDREIIEKERSKETVSSIMSEVNLASYEDPKEKRRRLEDACTAMGTALEEIKFEHERKKIELTEVKIKAVEKFGLASDEEIREAVSQRNNQQTEGQKEGGFLERLKNRFFRNSAEEESENQEPEINEKINNVVKLEDLVEIANFIEKKYKEVEFESSFKKSLKDEELETLRENYNNAMEEVKGLEEGHKKDALLKFYEKLDDLLKEKEEDNDPKDVIEDSPTVEEIEPIEITEETPEEVSEEIKEKIKKALEEEKDEDEKFIRESFVAKEGYSEKEVLSFWMSGYIYDFLQKNKDIFEGITVGQMAEILEEKEEENSGGKENEGEVTEKMKGKIRKELERIKFEDKKAFKNVEILISNYSDSERLFGEDFLKEQFDGFSGTIMSLEYEKIKNVKTKDFMAMFKKIYDEVKKENKEMEKVTKEMKEKIREELVKIKISNRKAFNDMRFDINVLSMSNKPLNDIQKGKSFDRCIKSIGINYDSIKNIKAKDFVVMLRKIYEEVKKEK